MNSPQIDARAVKERAKTLLAAWAPNLHLYCNDLSDWFNSPMMAMTVKGIAMMMPDRSREVYLQGLSFLHGLKASSSEELQVKVGALIDSLPDDQVARWGGVVAWVLTGNS